jgi:hypothetical protein
MNIAEVPKIYDILYTGETSGALAESWNRDAFINSLKIWLASFSGESMHAPSRGGYLTQFLMKPMSEANLEHMKDTIRVGLTNDFTPKVKVSYVQVIPHYKERFWEVNVSVYSPDLKQQIDMSEQLRSLV